jgi:hypothetical protein
MEGGKTRSAKKYTRQTLKKHKISNEAQAILNDYRSTFTITRILHGKKAIDAAIKSIFPTNQDEGKEWAKQFSKKLQNSAVAFYAKSNKKTIIKLIMGSGKDLQVIGHQL